MPISSCLQYQQMNRPALLDREISQPGTNTQNNLTGPTLLMRLGMSETHPSLLERMQTDNQSNNFLETTMKTQMRSTAWKKSPLTSWMKSSKISGAKRSRSLRPYPISSPSLISTRQELNVQKTLQSSIIHAHSMKSKPLLLQWLSEGNTPNEAYNVLENATLEQPILEMNNMMQLSMTSYCTSATNLRGGKDQYPRTLLMTILTAPRSQISETYNPTRSDESLSHKCLGSLMKKK